MGDVCGIIGFRGMPDTGRQAEKEGISLDMLDWQPIDLAPGAAHKVAFGCGQLVTANDMPWTAQQQ